MSAEFLKLADLSKSRYATKEMLINEMKQEQGNSLMRDSVAEICVKLDQRCDTAFHSA